MSYNAKALARQTHGAASSTGPSNVSHSWLYRTADTRATVEAAGYFNSAYGRLNKGDIVDVIAAVDTAPVLIRYLVTGKASNVITVSGTKQPLSLTAGTTLAPETHANRLLTLNAAAGQAIVLPAATGSGDRYRLLVGTTITSNTTTIKVANSSDIMAGVALQAADGGSTLNAWETAATDDTITMDGTTRGGIKGDYIELEDAAANLWSVRLVGAATGTEATPFSATV